MKLPASMFHQRIAALVSFLVALTFPSGVLADAPSIIDIQPCPACRVVGTEPLSEITLTFSEAVIFTPADITTRSRVLGGGPVPFALLQSSPSNVVTIQFNPPISEDNITVILNYTVTSAAGGEAIDGELGLEAPYIPTGNGFQGGQAVLDYAVLQGDVNGDGAVNVADQGLIGLNLGSTVEICTCTTQTPSLRLDLDDDGDVDDDDFDIATAGVGAFIPPADGTPPSVLSVTPGDGSIICGVMDTLSVQLTEVLNANTVTTSTLHATSPDGALFTSSSAKLNGTADAIDFVFAPALETDTHYTFTLSESLSDPSGELMVRQLLGITTSLAPTIIEQPAPQETCELDAAAFSVTATSGALISYQWRFGGVELAGENAASLSIDPAQLADAGDYDVVLTNACGETTSAATSLTVHALPTILSQPADVAVCEFSPASFTATADGAKPLAYQWRKDGIEIPGANNATLSFDAAELADTGAYDVVVIDANGCQEISDTADLVVNALPVFTEQPANLSGCEGTVAVFAVAASGSDPFQYQWRHNGVDIDGANADSLTISDLAAEDGGSYDIVVTDAHGCENTSATAALTVLPLPVITADPVDESECENDSAEFSVSVGGSGPFSYQWMHDGLAIPGATEKMLILDNLDPQDEGAYDVQVTDAEGCAASSAPATLTVNLLPVILTQPDPRDVFEMDTVTWTVTASGSEPLAWQWRKDGVDIPEADEATLTLSNVSLEDAGFYDCLITDALGCMSESDAAELTVQPLVEEPVGPSIDTQPADQEACEGDSVMMMVTASGTEPLSYQWFKNGSEIGGATAPSLTITPVTPSDGGQYMVTVTNDVGSATSDSAVLTVNLALTFTAQPLDQTTTVGGQVTFTVAVSGSAPISFQWRRNGQALAGETLASLTLESATLADAGDYDVEATNDCGSIISNAATLSVNQAPSGGGNDSDGDGVSDEDDACPDTMGAVAVDAAGCPVEPVENDNAVDVVPFPDGDGDGVPDDQDECDDSPTGVTVDDEGCPIEEPPAIEPLPDDLPIDTGDDAPRRSSSMCGACGAIGLINLGFYVVGLTLLRRRIGAPTR